MSTLMRSPPKELVMELGFLSISEKSTTRVVEIDSASSESLPHNLHLAMQKLLKRDKSVRKAYRQQAIVLYNHKPKFTFRAYSATEDEWVAMDDQSTSSIPQRTRVRVLVERDDDHPVEGLKGEQGEEDQGLTEEEWARRAAAFDRLFFSDDDQNSSQALDESNDGHSLLSETQSQSPSRLRDGPDVLDVHNDQVGVHEWREMLGIDSFVKGDDHQDLRRRGKGSEMEADKELEEGEIKSDGDDDDNHYSDQRQRQPRRRNESKGINYRSGFSCATRNRRFPELGLKEELAGVKGKLRKRRKRSRMQKHKKPVQKEQKTTKCNNQNPIHRLQQLCSSRGWPKPQYKILVRSNLFYEYLK